LGQAFVCCTVAFYIALGTFIIVVTPARIFQWLYDLAQRLSHLRLGWLALGAIIGMPQFVAAVLTQQSIFSLRLLPSSRWPHNGCDTMWICIRHERIWYSGNWIFCWICPCLFDFPTTRQQTPSSLEFYEQKMASSRISYCKLRNASCPMSQLTHVFQRAKGLPLIILIRMSPIPSWTWSNIFFSVE
jgi:hypothetical protein